MKKIKLALPFVLLCAVLLSACGGEVTAKKPLAELYEDIRAEVTLPSVIELKGESLNAITGIKEDMCAQYVAQIPDDVVTGDMLFLFEGKDADAAAEIEKKISAYRTQKLAEMKDYIPAEYDKILKSTVTKKGNFVWLVVSAEMERAEEIIKGNF